MNLSPLHHITKVKVEGNDSHWEVCGNDPQLLLEVPTKRKRSIIQLNVRILINNESPSEKGILYVDQGNGFTELNRFELWYDKLGNGSVIIFANEKIKRIRFDPISSNRNFTIKSLQFYPKLPFLYFWELFFKNINYFILNFNRKWRTALKFIRSDGIVPFLERLKNFIDSASLQGRSTPVAIDYKVKDFLDGMYIQEATKPTESSKYVPLIPLRTDHSLCKVKLIAFYLPQFHTVPENDEWWGKGFTEWTNVTRAIPQFVGHYQPHLPGEMGFYDLTNINVMSRQAELASHYGVYGFCFHHYWFGGRRILETPVNNFLKHPEIDIKFCLCWANENWSRRWDGSEKELLLSQSHSDEDDLAFISDLNDRVFNDARYIKVNGMPLLIIYKVDLLPSMKRTAERWRLFMANKGWPGIFIVAARTNSIHDPADYGCDATVEFPPHQTFSNEVTSHQTILNSNFEGHLYDYGSMVTNALRFQCAEFKNFKTVFPSWDNSARRPGKGHCFVGSTPEKYAHWLNECIGLEQESKLEAKFVFINAWNEWAEGAHLEPDRKNGYAYLQATANAITKYSENRSLSEGIKALNQDFYKKSSGVIILHAFYPEVALEIIKNKISKNSSFLDLIVTVTLQFPLSVIQEIKKLVPNVLFIIVENRGRDILPFIKCLKISSEYKYDYFCKIHTKKSPQMKNGDSWREDLLSGLIGSSLRVNEIINKFNDSSTGVVIPKGCVEDLSKPVVHVDNMQWLNFIHEKTNKGGGTFDVNVKFPAGSMIWGNMRAFDSLLKLNLDENLFENEAGQLDGTLAHAIERCLLYFPERAGYKTVII